jgi:hypothetical protein
LFGFWNAKPVEVEHHAMNDNTGVNVHLPAARLVEHLLGNMADFAYARGQRE